MLSLADLLRDGWCLEDGEDRHREAPQTFWIPDLESKKALKPGDFAKLIFRIAVANEEEPEAVERMWVIVREVVDGGYVGMLNNEPNTIDENNEFWLGAELRFEYRHIIDIRSSDEESFRLATEPAPIPRPHVVPN